MRITLFAALLLCLTQCQPKQPCAQKNSEEAFLAAIQCTDDFSFLMGMPLSSRYAQVDAVKLVYDLKTNALYFINNHKYNFHYEFCTHSLAYEGDLSTFNEVEYGHQGTRRFLLANLNYYQASDIYTLEFYAGDQISTAQIRDLYDLVAQKVYFREKLRLLAGGGIQLPDLDTARIISVNQLFANQRYQPMVLGKSYGYLQLVEKSDFETHAFTGRDIILTDFLPNDLPFCQGILTTAFQTPLAHINILSYNRKTPNCAYKTAWEDPQIRALAGKLVCYEVLADTFYLREASQAQAQFVWDLKRKEPGKILPCDLREKRLLDIAQIDRNSVAIVGAKAANFGELDKISLPDHSKIPTPEGAFAIPFYYYQQHITQHHLQGLIDRILQSDSILYNRTLLDKNLKTLRDSIVARPLDPGLLQRVTAKMKATKEYTDFRFRSSTNAEDIAGFTGAGLYTSKTGSLVRPDKTVDHAIKKVWASLWTLRAFEERMHANIDQTKLAMGILVHRAFGTEEVNGVAITRNLYREGYPSFTVNIQIGESSIVLPENQATPEQLLLNYGNLDANSDDFNAEYIAQSSLNDFKPILSKDELRQLAAYLYAIKKRFYYAAGGMVLGPDFYDFAMDIEFKLDKGTRKIYVKQAREY